MIELTKKEKSGNCVSDAGKIETQIKELIRVASLDLTFKLITKCKNTWV